jgi:hypothetical protein
MGSYGRNFEFRVTPRSGEREGRWVLSDTGLDVGVTAVPIGAPVVADIAEGASDDFTQAHHVSLATGAQVPQVGLSGILVYEHAPAAFAGDDPFLTTYSDKDTAPVGKLVQVVRGTSVKVVLRNTADRTFLNTREYAGRKMVAGIGQATPTLVVGNFLTPGVGDDTDGYWAETADITQAWLVITAVDNDRAEVEARVRF